MLFKNWKEICQVPDAHMRWALALIDPNSEFGQTVAQRFPEYFTTEEQVGPYPLSFLRREANIDARAASAGDDIYNCLATYGTCERFGIPTIYFNNHDNPMPADLAALLKGFTDDSIGHVVEWGGKMVVVVDNVLPDAVYLAPAELIAVDC